MRIYLIAIDTLRADHLHCYGYPRTTSPNLDKLAADGTVFEYCITPASHTLPTFTSVMTGQHPFEHNIIATLHCLPDNTVSLLPDSTPVLAELLYDAGYATYAVDNLFNFAFHPKWFVRGYQEYINADPIGFAASILAEEINAQLLPLIQRTADQMDAFTFVHYWDTHRPYNQPEAYAWLFDDHDLDDQMRETPAGVRYIPKWGPLEALDGPRRYNSTYGPGQERQNLTARKMINLYDSEIRYVDKHVGDVLDLLRQEGLYDESLIILFGDHGDDMAEHNCHFEHREVYDATVRVPLLVKLPRGLAREVDPPSRVEALVQLQDIFPTILELADVERPSEGMGRSLMPLLRGEANQLYDGVFTTGSFVFHEGKWKSVNVGLRTPEWKYMVRSTIRGAEIVHPELRNNGLWGLVHGEDPIEKFSQLPSRELYHLTEDPDEMYPVQESFPEIVAEMEGHIAWIRDHPYFLNR